MTHLQRLDQAGPSSTSSSSSGSTDGPEGDASGAVAFAFGSTTAQGAILFRLGEPVHLWSVDADGRPRWQRDLAVGESVACGPCPAALLEQPDGRGLWATDDGSLGPAPAPLDAGLVPVRSVAGVVLAEARPDGSAELLVPSSDRAAIGGNAPRRPARPAPARGHPCGPWPRRHRA